MKREIALATFSGKPECTDGDALFAAALSDRYEAQAVPWSDEAVDWERFDAVVVRSTWDYHRRSAQFATWLDRIDASGVRLFNSTALVRWNADKVYLRELEADGHTIAPTAWVDRGSEASLDELVASLGGGEVVVKPSISASAYETWWIRGRPGADDEARFRALASEHTVLVQPFLREVVAHGEWSILVFGGEYSHSVLKRPAEGDFRVQKEFGGTTTRLEPPAAILEDALRLVSSLAESPLYARVDGIERGGRFALLELELIEPDLFLEYAPGAPGRLARALERSLDG